MACRYESGDGLGFFTWIILMYAAASSCNTENAVERLEQELVKANQQLEQIQARQIFQ